MSSRAKLSDLEEKVLEDLLGAKPSVVAIRQGVSDSHVNTIKTRVRRKEANAKRFIRQLRKYRRILHPKRTYKGIPV